MWNLSDLPIGNRAKRHAQFLSWATNGHRANALRKKGAAASTLGRRPVPRRDVAPGSATATLGLNQFDVLPLLV